MRDDSPRRPARDKGRWPALLLAVAVHAAFLAVLIFAVRWQNRQPEPVTAELYAPPTQAPVAPASQETPPAPQPEPQAQPEPAPVPKPPPLPAAKTEPLVEKPDPRAAAIALKAQQDEQRRKKEVAEKEKQERAKKEAETREAEKKKQDDRRLAESRARQEREAQDLKLQAEREKAARVAQRKADDAAVAARDRAQADYVRRIQAKVRGNVILPPDVAGNPEAIFDVVQLPTGEIIDAALRKSSGVRAYDDAVQRAIMKSSPLPRADPPDLFQRTLTLKFRPLD